MAITTDNLAIEFESVIRPALRLALQEARKYEGATAPNPPVGATGLDSKGQVLSVQAHTRAGTGHAEAKVIEDCRERGLLDQLHTLVITLEPCNHRGRTGPCTEAILQTRQSQTGRGIQRVFFGVVDPNPRVAGQGAKRLQDAGIETHLLSDPDCEELIAPFGKWITTGLPWVTLKTAYNAENSMIPPPGQKTFSSPEALRFAHELRRATDAILTGSGTVLADLPEFTVRLVPDHPGKSRWLVVLDRRGRTPQTWIQDREKAGFRVYIAPGVKKSPESLPDSTNDALDEALRFLGSQGVLNVLVEGGPALTQTIINRSLWDRHVVITPQGIEIRKCLPVSSKKQDPSS